MAIFIGSNFSLQFSKFDLVPDRIQRLAKSRLFREIVMSLKSPGGTLPDFGWGRAIEAPKTYPFLIPIFRKFIHDQIYTRPNFRKSIPEFIPNLSKMAYLFVLYTKITRIDTVPYTKIVKIDTVPYTKIVKIDTLPDGTSPVPKIYIVPPGGVSSKNFPGSFAPRPPHLNTPQLICPGHAAGSTI